ncbi:polyisoprenoid-binding protein [Oleiagrimonas soli]|nr:polyisoprenoid-binding protein [Oleiagrimonas soli]
MSIRRRLACVLLLALTPIGAQAASHLYRFDPVHSQILFSISHNGYSHALGRLHIARGWLRFDPDDWSTAQTELDIDVGSVDMGDAGWSRTVRERSLLDAKAHPTAHFVSTSVRKTGDDIGTIDGKLTLRGVTRPVQIQVRLNRIGRTIFEMKTVAGFSGSAQLDRNAFGITRNPGSIGRTVTVRLEIEALRDDDARRQYTQETTARADTQ